MNKIPKCYYNKKNKVPLKIDKKIPKECISDYIKIKPNLLYNKSNKRTFGKDITNICKNIQNSKQKKKSFSYNDKDKVSQNKYIII